jgi:FkbM family methyltransferase
MGFVSYASNFEDVLLNRVFRDVEAGFYVDIGADHPTFSSTTKSFYDRGWSGINVEPGPNFVTIVKERRRDININAVITERDGEVDFFVNDDLTATSSVYEALHPAVAARVRQRSRKHILSHTLNSLVERHIQKKEVHFLKIDAEASERAIILATDWSRFRPMVIVAESNEPFSNTRVDQEWAPFLSGHGFLEVYFDGINTWFVREENRDFEKMFKIPVNVLDDFAVFDHEKLTLRARIEELSDRSVPSAPDRAPQPLARRLKKVVALLRR